MRKSISNFGQDRVDGLENKKKTSITTRNLQSAWQGKLLDLFHTIPPPSLKIYRLGLIRTMALYLALAPQFFSRQIPPTPGNVEQVSEAVELISLFRHQTLNSSKLALLHKALKTARLAMADRIVLNCTNTELLAANT